MRHSVRARIQLYHGFPIDVPMRERIYPPPPDPALEKRQRLPPSGVQRSEPAADSSS